MSDKKTSSRGKCPTQVNVQWRVNVTNDRLSHDFVYSTLYSKLQTGLVKTL